MIFFKPLLIIVLVVAITNGQVPHEEYGLPSEFIREFKAERTTKAPTKLPEIVLPKLPEPPRIPDTEYGLPIDNLVPFSKISKEIKIVEENSILPLPEVPRTSKVEVMIKPVLKKEVELKKKEIKVEVKLQKVTLPTGLPTLPEAPKIVKLEKEYGLPKEIKEVFKKVEQPKIKLPSGLPKLPEKPVLPKVPKQPKMKMPESFYPAPQKEYGVPEEMKVIFKEPEPQKEYGVPEEMKVIFKEPEQPKIMLPMGLPELPPKPEIPKIIEAPYSVEKEYGLPVEMKIVFKEPEKPKIMLPSGLPKLPPKPIIIQSIKKIEGPYPPAMPHKSYEIPMKMKILFKDPEMPKIMLPTGLPELPAKPVIPKIEVIKEEPAKPVIPKIEIIKEEPLYPSALPLTPTIIAPELPKIPVKPKPTKIDAPYPAKIEITQPGLIAKDMKVYMPKTSPAIIVEARPMFSAPYPAALPHSEYGLPPV